MAKSRTSAKKTAPRAAPKYDVRGRKNGKEDRAARRVKREQKPIRLPTDQTIIPVILDLAREEEVRARATQAFGFDLGALLNSLESRARMNLLYFPRRKWDGVSPKNPFYPLMSYHDKHGANHPWPAWMTKDEGIGWVPGDGHDHTFHGTSIKPANKKRGENVERTRKGGKASTFGAGSRDGDKMWQGKDEAMPCEIPGCAGGKARWKFESDPGDLLGPMNGLYICGVDRRTIIAIAKAGHIAVEERKSMVAAMKARGERPAYEKLVLRCACGDEIPWAKKFDTRSIPGMAKAQDKYFCPKCYSAAIAIGWVNLATNVREMAVQLLVEKGVQPESWILEKYETHKQEMQARKTASAAKPVDRKPVPAHAVNPKALTAFVAAGAVLSTPQSNNGHDGSVCTFCGKQASVSQWAFKVPANVRLELIELAVDEPVCRDCGAGLYHLGGGKVAKEEQPIDVAGVMAWAAKAKEHFANKRGGNSHASAPEPTIAHMEPEQYLAAVTGEKHDPAPAPAPVQTAPAASNNKPPCPIPHCELVLFKKNPFHSTVPGMQAAEGLEVCGVHVKALAGIAHQNVLPEKRAEMVDALLHPVPEDDGFEQAMDLIETVQDLAPVMA